MNALALRLLFVVLLLAAIVMGIVTVRHRIASAEARAAAAETTARRLQGELDQAALSEKVVIRYVDRVRVVREVGATITKEIPVYVTAQADAACPIPTGFVRVHDAAAQGVPLGEPAGDPDAPAPGVTLSAVADTVAGNYTACHETSEQLTSLQSWLSGLQAIETP